MDEKIIEIIKKIEMYASQNYVKYEVQLKLSLSRTSFDKILHTLSVHYPERYKKIQTQLMMNANNRKRSQFNLENKLSSNQSKKLEYAKRIANYELSLIDAAKKLHIPPVEFFAYLINVKDFELSELLKPVLLQFGVDEEKKAKISLQSYSPKVQKEFLLLSLTYRVSFKSLAKIIGSSVEDIVFSFLSFNEYFDSVNYLFIETLYENEYSEKLAFSKAKEYYLRRNKLMKTLKERTEGKEEIQKELKELQQEIYDTRIANAIKKDIREFTQEDKDLVAMYPIKYNLSLSESEKKLSINRKTISKYQNDLAARKPIFADKLNLYNFNRDLAFEHLVADNVKNSRGGF